MLFHGSLDNSKSVGTNNLIKEFAKIATDPKDIIKNYDFLHKVKNRVQIFNKEISIDEFQKDNQKYAIQRQIQENEIDEELKCIYKIITNNPIDINSIAKLSKLNAKDVMQKLTMLELQGKIKRTAGGRYIKI